MSAGFSLLPSSRPLVPSRCETFLRSALIALTWALSALQTRVALASTTTSTSLSITSGGASATSVAAGAVVTLTATVTASNAPLTPGLVNFCDASASNCLGTHLIGSAQLTSSGIASLRFRPAIGAHSYKAVFAGTTAAVTSASAPAALTVTGSNSTTSLAVTGSVGNYQLTATVTGTGAPTTPTGSLTFTDVTSGNSPLSTPPLVAGAVNFGFTNVQVNQCCAAYIVVADFNLDGIPDFLYANSGGEYLALGNGDGTFQTALNVSEFQARQIAVADFNEDGIPDIAIATESNGLSILLGHADGTFSAPSEASTQSFFLMSVGDFNGDGHVDLALQNSNGTSISILLGEGNGTFTTSAFSPTGLTLASTGDFNGDGRTDLVLIGTNPGGAQVYLSNGDGTFTAAPFANSPQLRNITVGDINGDGNLDVVATSSQGTNMVYVLRGGGDGTLNLASSTPTGSGPLFATIADLNGDGVADVAVTNNSSSDVTVLLGSGDGSFASTMTVLAGSDPVGIAAADFNGDGLPDLMVGNAFSNTITELLTQETTTSTATSSGIAVPGSGTQQVQAVYSGDSIYTGSSSSSASVMGGATTTTLNLAVSPSSSSTPGQQVLLSATLAPYSSQSQSTNGETVTFYSGSTNLGTGTLVNGYASLNVTNLPIGPNSLVAKYLGDPSFASSTSQTAAFDVAYATTLSLTASPATGNVYGQQVTLTATLSPATGEGKVTDGESVSFAMSGKTSSGKTLGTATLTAGIATLKTSAINAGTASLTANFAGDNNFSAASSNAVSFTTAQQVPTITWSQPAASVYTGAPVGSHLFAASSATSGVLTYTASLNGASPVAITPSSVFAAGVYTLTATLAPSDATDYTTTASAIVTYTVTPAPLTVVSANYSRPYGAANPAFSAQVTGALNNDSFTATGTTTASTTSPVGSYPVTYTVTGQNLANYTITSTPGTLTVTSAAPKLSWSTPSAITYGTPLTASQLNASASIPGAFTYAPAAGTVLFAGTASLAATFTPTDATDYSAQTINVPLTVNKAPLTLTANNVARVFGASNPTFTGTVSGAVNGDAFAETFATTATSASIVGAYPIVPSVTGTNLSNYGVTSTNGSLTISQAGTSTTFTMSNQNTTFTATVTSLTSGSPSGTVAFFEGQSMVGSGTIANGTATYTAGPLPAGDVVLSAQYSGDADFTQSASPPILNLAVTPSSASLTVTPGASTTDTIALATPNGYTGTVQLSCTGLPAAATCTFSPASVNFTGANTNSTSVLTITTDTSARLAAPKLFEERAFSLTALALVLWLPGALFPSGGRRKRMPLAHLLSILLLCGLGFALSGCGGSTTPSSTTGTTQQTPPGTSTIQVTATGTAGLSTTSSVSLTVQ